MQSKQTQAREVYAGMIGNVLEWYDFAVYSFLAPTIGEVFFPSSNPTTSLLAAYGAFAVGFFSRPLGSILFGHLGDRVGRKPTLVLSMVMMGVATVMIALLPGYAAIGPTASLLLLLLRAVQGISVAGEYGTSSVLLVERAPDHRRGLVGSWVNAGVMLGFLLGSAVGAATSTVLGDAAMADWGWRVPFALGALIAIHAIAMRRDLEEAPIKQDSRPSLPVVEALRHHYQRILMIIFLVLPIGVMFYICFVYASSYLVEQMHFSTAQALDISTLALAVQFIVSPAGGYLADRFGRRPMMFVVVISSIIASWPLWWLMHQPSVVVVVIAQVSFAVINGLGWAVTVPIMVELVPGQVRCSASNIAYNLCLGLFGGTAPWVATYLVARTSNDFAPAWYMIGTAFLALIATLLMPETSQKPLA